MEKGLTLENVVYDRQENKFHVEDSAFFWFTVLRKLFLYRKDPTKEKSREAYNNIAIYLEANLFIDSDQHSRLARTTEFFLAVEEGKTGPVENMLRKFPDDFHLHFFTHMRTLPGKVFLLDHMMMFPS